MSETSGLRLPDFIVVGPGRAGTTWLDRVLRGHVGLPRGVKETGFFRSNYSKGIEWYASHFTDCSPNLPAGEVCPCFFANDGPSRISRYIPTCKIIVTFRDPVERMYSYYKKLRRLAHTSVGFEETMVRHPGIFRDRGYAEHLRQWQATFGMDNVLVAFYDDLRDDQQRYLDRICDFIGIARIDLARSKTGNGRVGAVERDCKNRWLARRARLIRLWLKSHRSYRLVNLLRWLGVWEFCFGRGEKFPPLPVEVEARLRERFRPEVEALEKLVGRDLSSWKEQRFTSPGDGLRGGMPTR